MKGKGEEAKDGKEREIRVRESVKEEAASEGQRNSKMKV